MNEQWSFTWIVTAEGKNKKQALKNARKILDIKRTYPSIEALISWEEEADG